MKYAGNIKMLFAVLAAWALTACSTVEIPNVRPTVEIPFDRPEAVQAETLTNKTYWIPHEEWVNIRPYMIMISIKDWTKIKKAWLKSCRFNQKQCKFQVESIDKTVRALDVLAGGLLGE